MNNIEKLAIERMIYEHTGFNPNLAEDAETIKHIKNLLEAFTKAYAQQQTEPVWILSRDNKGRTTNFISGFPTKFDISKLPDGTELYATPPSTVPLEKYNNVLDALKDADELIGIEPFEHVAQEAADAHRNIRALIAEAEGKV